MRRTWKSYGLAIVCALALTVTACGGGDEEDLTGTWSGSIQDSLAGSGALSATISQSDSRLSGTWQISQNSSLNSGGTLSGTVRDDTVTLSLVPTISTLCTFNLTAIKTGDDRFGGNYNGINCNNNSTGSINLSRQK